MSGEKFSLPIFSGEKSDYFIWLIRFRQYAATKEFSEAVTETDEADLPATEAGKLTVGTDDAAIAARKRNLLACATLGMALKNGDMLGATSAARTADWPSGKISLMIKYLNEKFTDTSALAAIGAQEELSQCTMTKYEDPEKLMDKLDVVKSRYATIPSANVNDTTLLSQAIKALPSSYAMAITTVAADT
ncbi:MAG: hypothetical protein SGARI_001883, partial [Bacillariaceae sp.]